MGPSSSSSSTSTKAAKNMHDKALADMVAGLRDEAINRGATALMDEEVGSLGVPNPRILIVGCGGSGNNTLNRITHLGVEGAVTVAINTDKQHLDNTRSLQKLLVGRHITRGLGAGGDPSMGRRCAEAGREMIRRIVNGADHVFIASGDVISEFVLSGFNSFQALRNAPRKPFDKNRKGVNIGEVTASVLITHDSNQLVEEAVEILGEASCNDANHISGPSRTGEGLYRSMQSAFNQANLTAHDIDYISAHGTATSFNDEMEAVAFNRMHLNEVPLNSLKGYFGHSLGASGMVETIVGMHSLKNNILYKSLGFESLGVSQPINVIENTTQKSLQTFLKTASGFGGCNTAILFQKTN